MSNFVYPPISMSEPPSTTDFFELIVMYTIGTAMTATTLTGALITYRGYYQQHEQYSQEQPSTMLSCVHIIYLITCAAAEYFTAKNSSSTVLLPTIFFLSIFWPIGELGGEGSEPKAKPAERARRSNTHSPPLGPFEHPQGTPGTLQTPRRGRH